MRLFVSIFVLALTACAAEQLPPPSTANDLRYEPSLEMSVVYPEVRAYLEDGTCIRVQHGWRVVNSDVSAVLERADIGRITVSPVGNASEMLMDMWTEHAEEQLDAYGDQQLSPDCDHPYGCTVTFVRDAVRVHAFQAGPSHILEVEYPTDSRNGEMAVADAITTARGVGCPPTE